MGLFDPIRAKSQGLLPEEDRQLLSRSFLRSIFLRGCRDSWHRPDGKSQSQFLQGFSARAQVRTRSSLALRFLSMLCRSGLLLQLTTVFVVTLGLVAASTLEAEFVQSSSGSCSVPVPRGPTGGRIYDISKPLDDTTVSWGSRTGTPELRTPASRRARGDTANTSKLRLHTHLATHLDAPSHFLQDHLESGRGVEALDLRALNGDNRRLSLSWRDLCSQL